MQIYSPTSEPMRVVVFFSGGASSLKAMLADDNYGSLYKVVGAYTDKKDASGRQLCADNGIHDLFISRGKFYKERGLASYEWDSRMEFYKMLTSKIGEFRPDVICLSGYMHIMTEPLLTEYEGRVLNVHPADLSILDGATSQRLDVSQLSPREVMDIPEAKHLTRKFTGDDAVYDAIAAGETSARSTIHIVTNKVDKGPILVQSKPFPVDSSFGGKTMKQYAAELQERMKAEGDGPAYLKALELISTGRMSIEDSTVFLDDTELPYCGVRLHDW